ncbi:unnamed protein product [Allacma fusca]|uniref:Uncharacterized protein n=1 Tax=Allacma fusca TaxID=39272 RepID=A0A8J2NWF9_9HEXA|nr:unnamed protein product [Allacma fusca]
MEHYKEERMGKPNLYLRLRNLEDLKTFQQITMVSSKSLAFGVFLALFGAVVAGGSKDYGEDCTILGQLGNIFKSNDNDDPNACITEKGLFCGPSSKCICTPPTVWEKSGILSIFKGGKCVIAANLPCVGKEAVCVANAACGDGTVSYCKCNEGYTAKDGYCSGSSRNFLNVLYIVGLLLSYLMLTH